MSNLKVALLQLLPKKSLEENLQKGLSFCDKAKEMGADIALFPEMFSVGYNIPQDIERCKASAVSSDSDFVTAFGKKAKELEMAIGITYLEKHEPLPRNTLCLFDRFGKAIINYAKVHTCDFGDESVLSAGDDFYVADLDTKVGIVKIGVMICFDREFPESARILMLKGAEIILVPNACPMEINRLSQLRARAYENMVGIATANYPTGMLDCNGNSSAFDGMAYKPHESVSRDTLIMQANEDEGVFVADFNIDEIREYRKNEVHGNAYRHPHKYGMLLSESIDEPFLRNNYRK